MSDFFQKVSQQYNQKLPFVMYSKPNSSNSFGLLQNDTSINTIENYNNKGFVLNSFTSDKKFFFSIR